jgi:hypothetical protein
MSGFIVSEKIIDKKIADAASGGSTGYLSYVALFNQTGTDAPDVTELQNTIVGGVWSRTTTGRYKITNTGAFPFGKTHISGMCNYQGNWATMIPVGFDGTGVQGYIQMYQQSEDVIVIDVYNSAGGLIEYSTLMAGSILSLPEIRVYP